MSEHSEHASGTLYLIATPIGNLGDISIRAVQTLRDVDFIAAEDTRVSLKLLAHLEIKKQLISYYEYNRRESGEKIKQRILSGESCALITDAGTPGISDPGEDLVQICAESEIKIVTIPGPCAAIAALAISGLPAGRFTFEGFLSTARKSRFEHLNELKTEKRTMIFYEAPHKLTRTLKDMLDIFGDRKITLARELTKLYEETLRFTLSQAVAHFNEQAPRGEFVLVIEGFHDSPDLEYDIDIAVEIAIGYIKSGMSVKDSVKRAADENSISKNALYSAVLRATEEQ